MHQLLLLVKAFEQKISALMLSSYVSGTIIDVSSNEIIPEDATPPVNGSKKKKASVPLCSKGNQITQPFKAG